MVDKTKFQRDMQWMYAQVLDTSAYIQKGYVITLKHTHFPHDSIVNTSTINNR